MKQEKKSDVLIKIEEALESMKKRLYEIKKEENPSLDWKKFSKDFDSMKDSSDALLKNQLFQEEIDKLINLEPDFENQKLLEAVKSSIDFNHLKEEKKKYFPSFIVKALVFISHFIVIYFLSIIVYGIFSSELIIKPYYIFVLAAINALALMFCEIPQKSIKLFIYDPFLSYKFIVTYILLMIFINGAFYHIFESSLIWIIFIPFVVFLNRITGRNIHKIWWRY